MKTHPHQTHIMLLRVAIAAVFAASLAACGGGSSTPGDGTTTDGTNSIPNPDGIDVNADGFQTDDDDYNGDGIIDNTDVLDYQTDFPEIVDPDPVDVVNPNALEGNFLPDCDVVDCISENFSWSDNARVSQNESPQSTYALGIQRILYCLNYGGTADGSTIGGYADGIYGPNTAASVETYQMDKEGLTADGVVGSQTWDALQSELNGPFEVDAFYDYFTVLSSRPECTNVAMFYQLKAEPKGWEMPVTPGLNRRIPMSVYFADLP